MSKPSIRFSYLKTFLIAKGYTMYDLKCEVSLMFCSVLLSIYLKTENEGTNFPLNEDDKKEDSFLYERFKKLYEEINSSITSISVVQQLIKNGNQSKDAEKIAKLHEPYQYFYNVLVRSYQKNRELLKNTPNGNFWMPEVIALHIIMYLKENNYAFNKFEFIKNDSFLDVYDKYILANKDYKKLYNYKTKTKNLNEMTTIDKMRTTAVSISNDFISAKFN